jgi:hypothetical protein
MGIPHDHNPEQPPTSQHEANNQCANVLQLQTGIRRMIRYLHATAFIPVKTTWLSAIKRGYFTSWPGLTIAVGQQTLPTITGNRKGPHASNTTKHPIGKNKLIENDNEPNTDPPQEPDSMVTHQAFATIEDT